MLTRSKKNRNLNLVVQYGEQMKPAGYSAPSVKKAFKILYAITEASNGLGISDLSKKLKIGKSTVHGITSALEEMGVLVRDPLYKTYTLGYSLIELCRTAYMKIELKDLARKPMEKLMEKVGETIFLGVLNGDHVTIVDTVESRNEMKITSPPGTRLPLLAGATGRVLLSQIEKEKAKEIIQKKGLVRYTSKTVTDQRQFLREIEKAKKQGYAVDDEEYISGVRAVAAPLLSASAPPAALWVVGFTSTLDDQKVKTVIREIQEAVQKIKQSLEGTLTKGIFT
ncbi:MAG: IclR family transcriptional regulator [Desulfobacterales bacterium]|nr:IclR family transcriptional regulator [Desulfobacterales bacterium]